MTSDFLSIMLLPFIACFILSGMHAYLGLHIIRRGVIFVDLALAQMAALGATVGFLFGYNLHSWQTYLFALAFTLFGAFIFAITRHAAHKDEKFAQIVQEALIGIVYAVSSAATVLVLSRMAEGGEELKALLVGHLLFLDNTEVIKIGILYFLVGILHWKFRHTFWLITNSPEDARKSGLNLKLWDFIFYATFGVIVTSSVEIAGVLLVFSFLIVPAVCTYLLFNKSEKLFFAWFSSLCTTIIGLIASYVLDLPTGAAIVCCYGVLVLLCIGIAKMRSN